METDHYYYSLYIQARVKATLGTSQITYRYRLFVLCVFEVSRPPDGILLLHNCETDWKYIIRYVYMYMLINILFKLLKNEINIFGLQVVEG